MKRMVAVLSATFCCCLASFASSVVANVSSAQPFSLDGHSISVAAVTSWPVIVGDEIGTIAVPAVLLFPDGSRITLGLNSKLRIGGTNEEPMLVLVAGALDYKLVRDSKVSIARAETKGSPATYTITTATKPQFSPVLIASSAAAGVGVSAAVLVASGHGATGASGSVASTATGTAASSGGVAASAAPTSRILPPRLPPVSHFQ